MYSKKVRHGIISVFEEEQDIWGAVFTPDDTSSNSVIFWYDQTCDAVQGYVEENWDRLYEMQTAFVSDEKRDADATYWCSACREKIVGRIIDISEYGVYFHNKCYRSTTGPEMLYYMGVDETLSYNTESSKDTPQTRLRDPRALTGEDVYWR